VEARLAGKQFEEDTGMRLGALRVLSAHGMPCSEIRTWAVWPLGQSCEPYTLFHSAQPWKLSDFDQFGDGHFQFF
jgi:hypothetical protein